MTESDSHYSLEPTLKHQFIAVVWRRSGLTEMFKLVAVAEADVTGPGVIIRAKFATQINSAARCVKH